MLLDFTVSNWRLFTEPVSLSLQATKEQQHGERLTRLKKFGIRLLPNAILFGGNASGKSAFITSIEFMKNFVTNWNDHFLSRNLEPNKYDVKLQEKPSHFAVTLYLDDDLYEYSFSCTRRLVLEEQLSRSNSNSTYVLFHREEGTVDFDETQFSADDLARLRVIADGTDSRRLFLNNANEQKMFAFRSVYDWFQSSLLIIHPSSHFSRLLIFNSEEVMSLYNCWLPHLDNGIVRLEKEQITAKAADIPDDVLDQLMDNLPKDEHFEKISAVYKAGYVLVEIRRDGEQQFYRLVSVHKDSDGNEFRLKMEDGSHGTRRMLDLIPAFCEQPNIESSTIVIDEIDRSLHSSLAANLFRSFHSRSGDGVQDQIIASTHNLDLMTQLLFRRDEMWFFDRNDSAVELVSFSEFLDTKKDKDIRKSYLEGRMGGLPKLRFDRIFGGTDEDC